MSPSIVTVDASELLEKILDIVEAGEPQFSSRKLYDSKATHEELGDGFFPEGSQRVYVSQSVSKETLRRLTFQVGLLAKIPDQLIKIMRPPVWQGIMDCFEATRPLLTDRLLSQKSGYMLASTAALRLTPGAKSQPLHRDQIAYLVRTDPTNSLFTPVIGCLIAGSNSTYKNGATAVIPGSHLWGPERAPKVDECVYAEMAPGSALFTLGCGVLQTMMWLFLTFPDNHLPWSWRKQDQDEVLSTPVEIARRLPEDILKLAGYYKAVGGVGYVEDTSTQGERKHRQTRSHCRSSSPLNISSTNYNIGRKCMGI
ncbi:uncharacterized protein PAC_19438 [Phialocephala subalpina]|uniref:Phytanoyl-CoA dioxygenase family protein n=1 Tax=Phialocephala subalpina TaxID=576137 RepID=A0A1L7XX04_9HELO|nr:uncharacterized protein PAC_19438 [Phialocephala subalpina]